MNKKIMLGISLGSVAVLASAYVGGSWYAGKRIETQLNAGLTELAAEAPVIKVSDVVTKRGLFQTQHDMTIGLNADCLGADADSEAGNKNAQAMEKLKVRVRHKISHGPLTFLDGAKAGAAAYEGSIVFDEAAKQDLKRVLDNKELLSWKGHVDFDGKYQVQVVSPAFDFSDKGNHVTWSGVTGSITGDMQAKSYQIALRAPKMAFDATGKDGGTMQGAMENMQIQMQGRRGQSKLMLGSGTFGVDEISISGPKSGERISLSKLVYSFGIKETGQFIDVDAGYRFGDVALKGETPFRFGPAALEIAFEHLHGPSLASFNQNLNQLMCAKQKPKRDEMVQQWKTVAAGLLQNDPVFRLKQLTFGNASGEIKIHGKLAATGFKPAMFDDMSVAMAELPQVFSLDLEGSAPEKMLLALAADGFATKTHHQMKLAGNTLPPEQVAALKETAERDFQQKIELAAMQNYVKQENGRLSVKFSFSKGQATLNGQPFQLPFLSGGSQTMQPNPIGDRPDAQ